MFPGKSKERLLFSIKMNVHERKRVYEAVPQFYSPVKVGTGDPAGGAYPADYGALADCISFFHMGF